MKDIDEPTKSNTRTIVENNIQTMAVLNQELLKVIERKHKEAACQEQIQTTIANIEIINERLTKFYLSDENTDSTENKYPVA